MRKQTPSCRSKRCHQPAVLKLATQSVSQLVLRCTRGLKWPSVASRRLGHGAIAAAAILSNGCGMLDQLSNKQQQSQPSYHDNYGLRIEYPQVQQCSTAPAVEAKAANEPLVLEDPSTLQTFEMTLQEAVQLAVQQSPILRSIGGTIVSAPQATASIYDPALTSASPQLGTEAALSAFDSTFTQQLFWTKGDAPNNVDSGGFIAAFTPVATQSTGATYSGELAKQTAQGSSFALRHIVNYDRNNRPGRAFRSEFNGWLEAEWRQPMMQGAGTQFNRIAGPNSGIGQYNGVLIARVNEDVALADFELAMINLVADVEQAYWNLGTAYRVLDATLKGRNAAQQTFQYQQVRLEVGAGRSDEEAQAQSQFYQFQAQVESALGGEDGLYATEQRLRYLVGLTATDGRLIKPTSAPTDAKVVFDWNSALGQALERRVEIRRQKFNVKRRELEIIAARLNRRPRLDFLGQYRWRGLGDHLIGSSDKERGDNLYQDITDGNYQEWQAGLEMNFPVGLRAASVAVSHARLNLNRERALLAESELRVSHDLSDAARQIKLAHQLLETNYNRYLSDVRQVDVLQRRYRDGTDNINFLLQAQRQVVTSELDFYRALQTYNLAIRDFHRQKGSLLAYNQVQLAEGAWSGGAGADAAHVGRFLAPQEDPQSVSRPAPVSNGRFDPSEVQSNQLDPTAVTAPAYQSVPSPLSEPTDSGDDEKPIERSRLDADEDSELPEPPESPLTQSGPSNTFAPKQDLVAKAAIKNRTLTPKYSFRNRSILSAFDGMLE
ncbi:TolC family protein [Planctomycetes bacterium K23_9]|uniref:Outer membrane efflux protein n=1 Tax=Stieleria marina TaxID=1930275 RepID=A0A517NS61_9BACT|nr:Outer membrane efflux protein [Planctomycetes bacterium K23_9]